MVHSSACFTVNYACYVTGHTRAWTRHSRVRLRARGLAGAEVCNRCAGAGLGRARVNIEKQRAPDGLGALLTNILRVVADHRGGDALRVVRVERPGADARAAVLGAIHRCVLSCVRVSASLVSPT